MSTRADLLAERVVAMTAPGGRPLIALDHDGTLSPIAPRPDAAQLQPGARETLERLASHASIAVISGRGLDDLDERFPDDRITLISEHGLRSRLPGGASIQLCEAIPPTTLDWLRTQLHALLGSRAGWIVEDKGVALAVHHRLVAAAELQPMLGEVLALMERAARRTGGRETGTQGDPDAHIQVGKAVLELRPVGADKGSALRWLAARTAAQPVVMVGDDATVEPALLAAEQLGGIGVRVRRSDSLMPGSQHLDDPAEVVAFLDHLVRRLEQRSGTARPTDLPLTGPA
jgi:trehalose-phosphatase